MMAGLSPRGSSVQREINLNNGDKCVSHDPHIIMIFTKV